MIIFYLPGGRRYDGLSELSREQNDEFSTLIEFKTTEKFETGNKFTLINGNNVVLRGIITDVDYDRQKIYHYAGFDLPLI